MIRGDFVRELRERIFQASTPRHAQLSENLIASGLPLGHFNFSELVVLKAVAATARQLGVPVLVGVSESEREFEGHLAS